MALDYMMARYYSPETAFRFLSVDPGNDTALGSSQSWNQYTYVRNNPVAYFDPEGEALAYTGATDQDKADIKQLVADTRAISPDLDAALKIFEDPASNQDLNIGFGDAADPPGDVRFGQTESIYGKSSGKYKGSDVTIDKKDINSRTTMKGDPIDAKIVVIHEVVGHVNQDRQKTLPEQKMLTEKQREKKAKKETKRARKNIPKKDRPSRFPKRVK